MFGSHLSIAEGFAGAAREAEALGFDTVQIFTKNQRQWAVKPLDETARDEWLEELCRLGWQHRTVAHTSYLINLASADEALREKSIALMREELERAAALSVEYLVMHPGAHLGTGVEAGLERIAEALARLFRETRGSRVVVCLENTAGGGSTLGRSLEELAQLAGLIERRAGSDARRSDGSSKVAFCIDTCHALAAGYDLESRTAPTTPGGKARKRTLDEGASAWLAFMNEFDQKCGLDRLAVMHLNDSKGARGSHLDRHMHLGEGLVAPGVFRAIANHPALRDRPKILETPKEDNAEGVAMDTVNLRKLKRMQSAASEQGESPARTAKGRRA